MSEKNVEIVRRGYAHFAATGDFLEEGYAPDFAWDMSTFAGWPEQQVYPGLDGARRFMADWLEPWDHWELEVEALHDAGDDVVGMVRQHGRSRATGMPVDMTFAQVWSFRDGKQTRMRMYADPAEALAAVGL